MWMLGINLKFEGVRYVFAFGKPFKPLTHIDKRHGKKKWRKNRKTAIMVAGVKTVRMQGHWTFRLKRSVKNSLNTNKKYWLYTLASFF
jgi:hypothetical protein